MPRRCNSQHVSDRLRCQDIIQASRLHAREDHGRDSGKAAGDPCCSTEGCAFVSGRHRSSEIARWPVVSSVSIPYISYTHTPIQLTGPCQIIPDTAVTSQIDVISGKGTKAVQDAVLSGSLGVAGRRGVGRMTAPRRTKRPGKECTRPPIVPWLVLRAPFLSLVIVQRTRCLGPHEQVRAADTSPHPGCVHGTHDYVKRHTHTHRCTARLTHRHKGSHG